MRPLVIAIAAAILSIPFILGLFAITKDIVFFGLFTVPGWGTFKMLIGLVFLVAYVVVDKKN